MTAVSLLLVCTVTVQQPSPSTPIDWKQVDRVLGRSGNLQGESYRIGFPRSDLHVTVGKVVVKPALALGSWVAFKQTGDSSAMVMGDLVLLPSDVGPVVDALQRGNGAGAPQPHLPAIGSWRHGAVPGSAWLQHLW